MQSELDEKPVPDQLQPAKEPPPVTYCPPMWADGAEFNRYTAKPRR